MDNSAAYGTMQVSNPSAVFLVTTEILMVKVSVHIIWYKERSWNAFDGESLFLQEQKLWDTSGSFPFALRLCWGTGLLIWSQGCAHWEDWGRPGDIFLALLSLQADMDLMRGETASYTGHTLCGLSICHLWSQEVLSWTWNVHLSTVDSDINYLWS